MTCNMCLTPQLLRICPPLLNAMNVTVCRFNRQAPSMPMAKHTTWSQKNLCGVMSAEDHTLSTGPKIAPGGATDTPDFFHVSCDVISFSFIGHCIFIKNTIVCNCYSNL